MYSAWLTFRREFLMKLLAAFGLVSSLLLPHGLPGLAAQPKLGNGSLQPFSLQVNALMNMDGTTDVYLTVGIADPTYALPSTAKQIQLKAFDSAGGQMWTQIYHDVGLTSGTATFNFPGLVRHGSIAVHELVQTSQTTSTKVLDASGTIFLRPDPAVLDASSPDQVRTNQTFHVNATIEELNKDVGATFDVLLFVGDTQVDQATAVSVPAGGMINVTLLTRVSTPGTYTLTVKLVNVAPREWSESNKSAQAQITVVEERINLRYTMRYIGYHRLSSIGTQTVGGQQSSSLADAESSFYYLEFRDALWNTYGLVSPLQVNITFTGDGQVKASHVLQNVMPVSSWGDPNGIGADYYYLTLPEGGYFLAESYHDGNGGGVGYASVIHAASMTAYYSGAFVDLFNPPWTVVIPTGTMWNLRNQWTANMVLSDATQILGGSATVPVAGIAHTVVGPGPGGSTDVEVSGLFTGYGTGITQ
jgi:hypothetical protein